jgi:hypothetical protein
MIIGYGKPLNLTSLTSSFFIVFKLKEALKALVVSKI